VSLISRIANLVGQAADGLIDESLSLVAEAEKLLFQIVDDFLIGFGLFLCGFRDRLLNNFDLTASKFFRLFDRGVYACVAAAVFLAQTFQTLLCLFKLGIDLGDLFGGIVHQLSESLVDTLALLKQRFCAPFLFRRQAPGLGLALSAASASSALVSFSISARSSAAFFCRKAVLSL
jgi:hypothetical protein